MINVIEHVKIKGEDIAVDKEQGFLELHIREPFHLAGKIFHWRGQNAGIGISYDILMYALHNGIKHIHVTVGRSSMIWVISTKVWISFCKRTQSTMRKNGTMLYVAPWKDVALFRPIEPFMQYVKVV